jgi:putative NIF3 family GTP cyclohydrolase 1 type 2
LIPRLWDGVIALTNLADIIQYLEKIAPLDHALEGELRGIQVGPQTRIEQSKTTINRILIATYPSSRIAATASQDKANLILCYRPLFAEPISSLSGTDLVKVRLLSKNYISVYAISSSYVGAQDGLTDALIQKLGLKNMRDFLSQGAKMDVVRVGALCSPPEETNHSGFANYVASRLGINNVQFTGDLDADVDKLVVVAGNHFGKQDILRAKKEGADTVLTGEVKPNTRRLAHESQLNLFEILPFATENPGMERLRHQLSLEFPDLKIAYSESKPFTDVLRPYSDSMA